MRPRFLPRAAGLLLLYGFVFFLLVYIQFARRTGFSRKIGDFTVSGKMHEPAQDGSPFERDAYLIKEEAKVTFGGLDFVMANNTDNPLLLVDLDGNETPLTVTTLKITGDTAWFLLSNEVELSFRMQQSSGTDGLLISSTLPEQAAALYLPYVPAAFTKITADDMGHWTANAQNNNFTFDRPVADSVNSYLYLRKSNPIVFYHTIPEGRSFNPAIFMVQGSAEQTTYENLLGQWLDKVYGIWEKTAPASNDEFLVTVFLAEAARRGSYANASSSIPPAFINSSARTYLSAPFLGRLDAALRSLVAEEKTETARLPNLIRENPRVLLEGNYAFTYRALPETANLINERGLYAQGVELSDITIRQTAGIFESFGDWARYFPGAENPFARLIPRALDLAGKRLAKDGETGTVFVFDDEGQADVQFNLRLGLGLLSYGDAAKETGWASIGRSLVLSALALTDERGELPAYLSMDDAGRFTPDESGAKITAAQCYPDLPLAVFYPHTTGIAAQNGIWAWTVSPKIDATFNNQMLDINVSFPVNETHHLLIRGVAPFTRIYIRNMDYRSDPRFEQYPSPGWVYSASERTLLVKLVHRSEIEHIRIFY